MQCVGRKVRKQLPQIAKVTLIPAAVTLVNLLVFLINVYIDSDKDKKKNNLKHRTSSQMLGGAPGVNPGSSNLNNMWKRGGQ